MLPGSKETELGSSNNEASPSAGKDAGIVLVPHCTWKRVLTAISGPVDVYLSLFNLFLTQSNLAITSIGCKPDNFESHNALKLTFTTIRGLVRILLNGNLSLNQTLLTFLLCVR